MVGQRHQGGHRQSSGAFIHRTFSAALLAALMLSLFGLSRCGSCTESDLAPLADGSPRSRVDYDSRSASSDMANTKGRSLAEETGVTLRLIGIGRGEAVDVQCRILGGPVLWGKALSAGAAHFEPVPADTDLLLHTKASMTAPYKELRMKLGRGEQRDVVLDYHDCVVVEFRLVASSAPTLAERSVALRYKSPLAPAASERELIAAFDSHGLMRARLEANMAARLLFAERYPLVNAVTGDESFLMVDLARYSVALSTPLCEVKVRNASENPVIGFSKALGAISPINGSIYVDPDAAAGEDLLVVSWHGWASVPAAQLRAGETVWVDLRPEWLSLDIRIEGNVQEDVDLFVFGPLSGDRHFFGLGDPRARVLPLHEGCRFVRMFPAVPGDYELRWMTRTAKIRSPVIASTRVLPHMDNTVVIEASRERVLYATLVGVDRLLEFLDDDHIGIFNQRVRHDADVFELPIWGDVTPRRLRVNDLAFDPEGLPVDVLSHQEQRLRLRISDRVCLLTLKIPAVLGGRIHIYPPSTKVPLVAENGEARVVWETGKELVANVYELTEAGEHYRGHITLACQQRKETRDLELDGRWVDLDVAGSPRSVRVEAGVRGASCFLCRITVGTPAKVWIPEHVDTLVFSDGTGRRHQTGVSGADRDLMVDLSAW